MKTAIITGASVGIGRATAQAFLQEGFEVFNLSRRACPVERCQQPACDLAVEHAIAPPARPDSAMRTAPTSPGAQCQPDAQRQRRRLRQRQPAPGPGNQRGRRQQPQPTPAATDAESSSVLYVGSTLSEKAVPGSFSYVVSKHAQLGMMRATCQDLMGSGIHTATGLPGLHRYRDAAHPPGQQS